VTLVLSEYSNLVVLHKGEGIAIQPNVIHAYVEGDVIEVRPLETTVLITVHGQVG
jgi:mannose-6-phosphate isomerase class I